MGTAILAGLSYFAQCCGCTASKCAALAALSIVTPDTSNSMTQCLLSQVAVPAHTALDFWVVFPACAVAQVAQHGFWNVIFQLGPVAPCLVLVL